MADEIVWYRAETAGFVGHEGDIGPDYYCYATSDLNAARAYAAIREHRSGVGRSVYRVELLAEAEPDPDYWKFPQFIRCLSVMLAEVVEARPTMTPEEGTKYMCDTYSPWPEDGTTPMYDDEGYPTASPAMRRAGIGADALRHLGRYEDPRVIGRCASELVGESPPEPPKPIWAV